MKTKTEQSREIREIRKKEIIDSRKGGFGGSDADMFARVGLNGLSALSDTDKRRIAVALGQIEYVPIQPTEAMERGNDFEDFVAQFLINQVSGCKREVVIEKKLARNFRTFAHADFYFEEFNSVIETKCTSGTLEEAIERYMPQLQWYYLLGVDEVYLWKGDQKKEFDFESIDGLKIERNEQMIQRLENGIKLIDDFCENFQYVEKDEWTIFDLLPHEQRAAQLMYNYLEQIKIMEAEVEKQKQMLFEVMDKNGVKSIKSDKYVLTVVPESVRSTFDKKKLLKEHPEINEADYLKTSICKPYLKIILK